MGLHNRGRRILSYAWVFKKTHLIQGGWLGSGRADSHRPKGRWPSASFWVTRFEGSGVWCKMSSKCPPQKAFHRCNHWIFWCLQEVLMLLCPFMHSSFQPRRVFWSSRLSAPFGHPTTYDWNSPILLEDASQARTISFFSLKWVRTLPEESKSLMAAKATCCLEPHFHTASFSRSLCRGLAINALCGRKVW